MKLPLVIGRNSSGEEQVTDLKDLPHLFISYNEDLQLRTIFIRLIRELLGSGQPVQLALSLGRELAKLIPEITDDNKIVLQFMHAEFEDHNVNTIDEFITLLLILLKERKRMKRKASRHKIPVPATVVFIDDIFEVIRSANKKTSLAFIELLVGGPYESIHFIAGSAGIYKNLLNQLIHLSPVLKRKLQKTKHLIDINEPLASELIMNPDGLIFFKERVEKGFMRLYPR